MPRSSDTATAKPPHPMTLSEFGRRVGRARSTITELVQGPLSAARLQNGRIDAACPVVAAWLTAKGIDRNMVLSAVVTTLAPRDAAPTAQRPSAVKVGGSAEARGAFSDPIDVAFIDDLTLRQIVARYGSRQGCSDFLAMRKVLADTRRIELANAARAGELIDRELVSKHVIGHLRALHSRLLTDTAATIARRLHSESRAGRPIQELEALVRELVGSQLAQAKADVKRALAATRPAEAAA